MKDEFKSEVVWGDWGKKNWGRKRKRAAISSQTSFMDVPHARTD